MTGMALAPIGALLLIACLIVGVYLYGADLVFKRVVQDVFLR